MEQHQQLEATVGSDSDSNDDDSSDSDSSSTTDVSGIRIFMPCIWRRRRGWLFYFIYLFISFFFFIAYVGIVLPYYF